MLSNGVRLATAISRFLSDHFSHFLTEGRSQQGAPFGAVGALSRQIPLSCVKESVFRAQKQSSNKSGNLRWLSAKYWAKPVLLHRYAAAARPSLAAVSF